MLLEMDSVEVSHKTLFTFEVGSVLQGVERVAELAVGVYHIETMRAREADTIDLEDVSVSQANEIKNKSYEDTRIYKLEM